MLRRLMLLLLLPSCLCWFACQKDPPLKPNPIEPPVPCWQKFVGTYDVWDTINNLQYEMRIKYTSGINEFGSTVDSLRLFNYANKFNFTVKFRCFQPSNFFSFLRQDPIKDHNGKRWYLWSNTDDTTTTSVKENFLVNDTLVLFFDLDNIKYYIPDAVSYYACECKHIAVKRNE